MALASLLFYTMERSMQESGLLLRESVLLLLPIM